MASRQDTSVVEVAQPVHQSSHHAVVIEPEFSPHSEARLGMSSLSSTGDGGFVLGRSDDDPPADAVSQLQRWNGSRRNVYKTLATFMSFVLLGMNDAAYGVSAPIIGPNKCVDAAINPAGTRLSFHM